MAFASRSHLASSRNAIPNLLRARMAANESSAVASVRTVTTENRGSF